MRDYRLLVAGLVILAALLLWSQLRGAEVTLPGPPVTYDLEEVQDHDADISRLQQQFQQIVDQIMGILGEHETELGDHETRIEALEADEPEPPPPPPANEAPTAAISGDTALEDTDGDGFEHAELSGAASTDPEGGTLTYLWSQGGQEVGQEADLFLRLPVGSHVVTLSVTDPDGLSDTTGVTVTVDPFVDPGALPDPHLEAGPVGAFATLAECVADMEARNAVGQWTSCGTAPAPFYTRDEATSMGTEGNNGPRCIVDAWTDGAWDGETLYLHGGGHFCYAGSEWLAFHAASLTHRRLNHPTPFSFDGPTRLEHWARVLSARNTTLAPAGSTSITLSQTGSVEAGQTLFDRDWNSLGIVASFDAETKVLAFAEPTAVGIEANAPVTVRKWVESGRRYVPFALPTDWPPEPDGGWTEENVQFPLGVPLPPAGQDGVAFNPTHSYGGMAWLPGLGIIRNGGIGYYRRLADLGEDDRFLWAHSNSVSYDPTTNQWTYWGALPRSLDDLSIGTKAIWDSVTGRLFQTGRRGTAWYDPFDIQYDMVLNPLNGAEYPVIRFDGHVGHSWSAAGTSLIVPPDLLVVHDASVGMRFWRIASADGEVSLTSEGAISRNDLPPTGQGGLAWHPERQLLISWSGTNQTWTVDPATRELVYYPNPDGPVPNCTSTVFGKFAYHKEHDVFLGICNGRDPRVWFYRLPAEPQPDPARIALVADGFTCADSVWGWPCPDLGTLVSDTAPGGTLTLPKGVYRSCAMVAEPITIDGAGSVIEQAVCGGKGAFVANATLTLENLECRQHGSHSDNQACVRRQTNDITMRNVYCHDSSTCLVGGTTGQGVALSGTVTIEDSLIERVGGNNGRSHGIYARNVDQLIVRDTVFRCMVAEGHHVKTGARSTLLERVTLDGADCSDSRLVDAYAGGELVIRDSTLTESTADTNRDMIAYVAGGVDGTQYEPDLLPQAIDVQGTTFDCGAGANLLRLGEGADPAVTWAGNTTTGSCGFVP